MHPALLRSRMQAGYRTGQAAIAAAAAACPPHPIGKGAQACDPSWREGCRYYPLPFDSGVAILAGATAVVIASPQKDFIGQVLVVPSDRAPSFTIDNLSIGTDSQLVALGVQSAVVYSEVSVHPLSNMDPAEPGIAFLLTVTNIGVGALRFFATIHGTSSP